MVERLAEYLWHKQYGIQNTNFSNVRILYRAEANGIRVIVMFGMDDEVWFSQEQYLHILEQVEKSYYEKGYERVEILSLLCTRNVETVKPYCQIGRYTHWVVDTVKNRLLVFENQPQTFGDVRNQLENLLIGELHKVGEKYSNPVKMKPSGYNGFKNSSFRQRSLIRRLEGKPVFTILLVLVNVLILMIMKITENYDVISSPFGNFYDTGAELQHLIDWGATNYSLIVDHQEYYRLFTAMFLHGGFEHLVNNMVVLAVVGYMLETNFGSVRFLIIYLVSGVLANIGSIFYFHETGENIVGVGASGAIFGIVGAFVYLVLRYRGRGLDVSAKRFIFFVMITVYSGFRAHDNIDNAAHIVGFFVGILTCIMLDLIRRNKRMG